MMERIVLTAICLVLAPGAARGEDSRVRTIFYQPQRIVAITGRPDIQSTIVFSADERIENVAIGDSAAWQVTPNRRANLLFLKPQQAHGRTNMTVVTDRHTYMFNLVAQGRNSPALYELQFTYPPLPPPPKPAPPVEAAAAPAPATPAPAIADLNFGWRQSGARRLFPARAFDDGKSLYLGWSAGVAMPAMLSIAPDGTEGPVNYTSQGEFVVVDGVPGRLVLRSGKEVAYLDRDKAIVNGAVHSQLAAGH